MAERKYELIANMTDGEEEIIGEITVYDGETPYIKDGYWWIGETNTNVKAEGKDGKDYVLTDADKNEIADTVKNELSNEIVINEQSGGYYTTEGEWVADEEYISKFTDLIPTESGKSFYYKGIGVWGAASVLWYDSNNVLLSYEQHNEWGKTPSVVIVTTPANAAYVRFCSFDGIGYDVVLEVSYFEKNSVLSGKKIVYDGDSICYGAGYKGGYAKLIADKIKGLFDNQAIGGGRLITAGTDGTFHSVVDNLVNLSADGDLYCFEGGINDYWTNSVLGTFDYTNFSDSLDTSTVCGALETIFRYCLNNFVGKPICFVITHKIQGTAYAENSNGDSFKDYHDAMVGICEKYSIPYYDAFNKSGLNGWNTAQNNAFLTGNSNGEPDGCHPNEQGYKRYYVPQLISLFESMMPTGVVDPEPPTEPTYTNLLDEAGYTKGVYLSNGNESADANAYTTGYMRVGTKGTVYLKNITMPNEASHGNRLALYNESKGFVAQVSVTTSLNGWNVVTDENGNITQFSFVNDNAMYIRLSAWQIDETSIITINEPIE